VFPSAKSATGHIFAPGKAWQKIRARTGVPDVRIHDLRHTLASWMISQGKQNLPIVRKGTQSPPYRDDAEVRAPGFAARAPGAGTNDAIDGGRPGYTSSRGG
jgi:hypothetical protein